MTDGSALMPHITANIGCGAAMSEAYSGELEPDRLRHGVVCATGHVSVLIGASACELQRNKIMCGTMLLARMQSMG
jgi:hypothetical protein